MNDIQGELDKEHSVKKKATLKAKKIHIFAYGHNTNTETLTKLVPSAESVGVGTLYNFELYFEEFANIRMDKGASVKGVVWQLESSQLKKLDGYEALHKDYNRLPVEVTVNGKEELCIAYIMDPTFEVEKLHKKPTKDYIETVAMGYKVHGIPLEQIRKALKES